MTLGGKLILVLFIPWLGVLMMQTVFRKRSQGQIRTVQIVMLAELAMIIHLFGETMSELVVMRLFFPGMELALSLQLDRFAYLFLLMAGIVWGIAAWTSCTCLPGNEASLRYRSILLGTLSAVAGVFIAGDFMTLFLFYELMTILSYGLVVSDGSARARGAGRTYLIYGIISGLFLLAGVLMMQYQSGNLLVSSPSGQVSLTVPFLLLVGFGIKAGMLPCHGWMPETYGSTPASGAAVLSGVLSKAGVYGMLRVALSYPLPAIGTFLNVVGVAAMLWGGYAAVRQKEPRDILAYSSVSQIGFILMGLGSGILIGGESPYGFQGAVFHAFNHGLFKSGLFLTVGVLLDATCRRGREMVLGAATVFMLGMIGIPFFSGGASKTLLHHAWTDILQVQGPLLRWPGEIFFVLIGALTVIYCVRLYRILAVRPDDSMSCTDLGLSAYWPILAGALIVIGMGWFPQYVNQYLVAPAAGCLISAGLKPTTFATYYAWQDLLTAGVIVLTAWVLLQKVSWVRLIEKPPPDWISGQTLVRPLMAAGWYVALTVGYTLEENLQLVYDHLSHRGTRFVMKGYTLEERLQQVYDDASKRGADFIARTFFEDVDRWNLDTGIRVVSVIMAFLLLLFFIRYFFS
jgi:hydrogenase-4 component B